MKQLNLTAVFVEGEFGYTAYIDEMRGVITQGKTIDEAEENLIDALEMYLEPEDPQQDDPTVVFSAKHITRKPFISLTRTA